MIPSDYGIGTYNKAGEQILLNTGVNLYKDVYLVLAYLYIPEFEVKVRAVMSPLTVRIANSVFFTSTVKNISPELTALKFLMIHIKSNNSNVDLTARMRLKYDFYKNTYKLELYPGNKCSTNVILSNE